MQSLSLGGKGGHGQMSEQIGHAGLTSSSYTAIVGRIGVVVGVLLLCVDTVSHHHHHYLPI